MAGEPACAKVRKSLILHLFGLCLLEKKREPACPSVNVPFHMGQQVERESVI